jgi:hypothetical protein
MLDAVLREIIEQHFLGALPTVSQAYADLTMRVERMRSAHPELSCAMILPSCSTLRRAITKYDPIPLLCRLREQLEWSDFRSRWRLQECAQRQKVEEFQPATDFS